MLNLKKTAVAVLAFGSSAVFAGTMGPVCTPGSVTVPCERSAWDFGVKALYLRPSSAGFNYFGDTGGSFNNFDDNWGWGFKLEGSYHFSTGNDMNLNWYHYNKSNSRTLPAGFTLNGATTAFSATGAVGTVDPKWDAVNLEFGQHVDFGDMTNIRFHAGAQYARINGDVTIDAISAANSFNIDRKFNGFGPRFGADLSLDWGNGFAVYGNTAMAMLVGKSKFNTSAVNTAGVVTATTAGSTTIIVPELEAKLGLMYTYAMAQGDLSLDLGWMFVNYFNAEHAGVATSIATQSSDFGVQGPYIGLKWIGNVA